MTKNVFQVISDTNIGGAGKYLLAVLGASVGREDLKMQVILPPKSLLKPEIDKMGIPVHEVDGIAEKSFDFGAISVMRRIFKEEKADVVNSHACMSARIAARQAGCKVIYTRHSVFEPSKKISKGIGKFINGAVNNYYADAIVAVAEAAKDNIVATGVNPDKIQVVLNGVNGLTPATAEEKVKLRKRFGIADDEKAVSIVARLEDIKGHIYFIEAAKRIKDKGIKAKFFIAGTGSYEQQLREKAKELELGDTLVFTGFLKDVDCLMKITDIQANASYGTEATSLALLEGMSIGIPAVVSDFGGNPGVIQDGVNGFVVPKKNSEALAEGLLKLLTDEELHKKQSENAVKVFNDKFTVEKMVNTLYDIYLKI